MTAKKKKGDIANMDVVDMVKTMSSQQQIDKAEKNAKQEMYPKAKGLVGKDDFMN